MSRGVDATDAALRRVLARLGEGTAALTAPELARRLLSLRTRLEGPMARELLGAALGAPAEAVPDCIDAAALVRLLHGPVGDLPLEQADYVVVDLETTGVSMERASILEIGAVRVRGGCVADRFETLVDPGGPIPASITALTGIERETVDGAPALPEAMDHFEAWLAHSPGAPFVAHNARFDEGFVRRALAMLGRPPLGRPVLCTRKLARRIVPEIGRFGLDAVSAHFGISNHARHRALGDALATARALVEMLALARERRDVRTVGDLLALQAARPRALRGTPDRVARGPHR